MIPRNSKDICVIGIGNEYRGDDSAGLLAARCLSGEDMPGVIIIEMNGETTALMDAMGNSSVAILIDAMQSGAKAGTITRFDAGINPLPETAFRCSTHAISVGETIELARALSRLPQHVIVYGIEGARFEPDSAISPEVSEALKETVERVTLEIQSLRLKINRSSLK